MIEFLIVIIKTFSNGENSVSNICRAILFIYRGKFQVNLFLIYPLELLFLDEQSGQVDSVKIKWILSCRTNYITKQ